MAYTFKYWIRAKWRKFRGICQCCGADPINNKFDILIDPFYSDVLCHACVKLIRFSSMYGMGRRRLIALVNKSNMKQNGVVH